MRAAADTRPDFSPVPGATVIFDGLLHSSLGTAALTVAGDSLAISSIGSGGADGVAIDLTGARGLRMTNLELRYLTAADSGASIVGTLRGVVAGVPGAPIAVLRTDVLHDRVEIRADFSGVSAPAESILVSNGAVVVHHGVAPAGQLVRIDAGVGAALTEQAREVRSGPGTRDEISITFGEVHGFTFGATVAAGDRIVFSRSAGATVDGLGTFELRVADPGGAHFDPFYLRRESLRVFDQWASARGEATLIAVADSALTVADVGVTGADGVDLDVAPSHRVEYGLSGIGAPSSYPSGAFFKTAARGELDGSPDQSLGTLRMEVTAGGSFETSVDFTPQGTSTQRIELFLGNTATAATVTNVSKMLHDTAMAVIRKLGSSLRVEALWDEPVDVNVEGLGSFTVDRVLWTPVAPLMTGESIQGVTLTGAGIGSFTLLGVQASAEPTTAVPAAAADPTAFRFAGARPNPGRGQATLRFEVPGPGRLEVDIYDVSGRLVRRLAPLRVVGGERLATWNGRRHDGAIAEPGVYFVRGRLQLEDGGPRFVQGRLLILH
jgi:hypothetical protein